MEFKEFQLSLGEVKIGCIKTPMRGSYFCEKHQGTEQTHRFKYKNGTAVVVALEAIKAKVGKIKSENLIIYDAFIDKNDTLLLLVNYSDSESEFFWVTQKQIKASKVVSYIEQLKMFEKPTNFNPCSSSKKYTLPCNKKARTVGMFLGVYNCGIIVSFKEIFHHETIAQAASFFMGIIDYCMKWPKVSIKKIKVNI